MSLPTVTTDSPVGSALNINAGITLLSGNDAQTWESGGFTASLWFKSTSSSGQSAAKIISRDHLKYWSIAIDQSSVSAQGKQSLIFSISTGDLDTEVDSYTTLPVYSLNAWHHLAISYNGTHFVVYVNGKSVFFREEYAPNSLLFGRDLVVGADTATGGVQTTNKFVGGITDVKLFANGLAAKKVRAIYESPGSSVSGTTDNTLRFGGGTSGNNLKISGEGISAGHSVFASAPFSVTPAGATTIAGFTITDILDEDNMASDSATALATQQSIKAYVDANSGGGGSTTLGGLTDVTFNQTGSGDLLYYNATNSDWRNSGGVKLDPVNRRLYTTGGDFKISTADQLSNTYPAGPFYNVLLQYYTNQHEDRLEVTAKGVHVGTDDFGTYTAGGTMVNTDQGFGMAMGDTITNTGWTNFICGGSTNVDSNSDANNVNGWGHDVNNTSNALITGAYQTATNASHSVIGGETHGILGSHNAAFGYNCSINTSCQYNLITGYDTLIGSSFSLAGGHPDTDSARNVQVNSDASIAYGAGARIGSESPNSQAFGKNTRVGISSNYSSTNLVAPQGVAFGNDCGVTAPNGLAGGESSNCASLSGAAWGQDCTASYGDWSTNNQANFAFGLGTQTPVDGSGNAMTQGQFVVGKYNEITGITGGHMFAVGSGTSGTRDTVFNVGSNGYVGIGVINPSYSLQLSTNSAAKPTSSTWTVVSDSRVKTNVREYTKGLAEIVQLEPKLYDYNGKAGFGTEKDNIGIIAQDVLPILPESINTYEAKLNPEDTSDTELYNFDFHAVNFALINAVKELKQEIDSLKARVQELENS